MKNYEEHGYFDIDIRQQIDNVGRPYFKYWKK